MTRVTFSSDALIWPVSLWTGKCNQLGVPLPICVWNWKTMIKCHRSVQFIRWELATDGWGTGLLRLIVAAQDHYLNSLNHYLYQHWGTIRKVHGNLSDFITYTAINPQNYLENYLFQISFKSSRTQWVFWFHLLFIEPTIGL